MLRRNAAHHGSDLRNSWHGRVHYLAVLDKELPGGQLFLHIILSEQENAVVGDLLSVTVTQERGLLLNRLAGCAEDLLSGPTERADRLYYLRNIDLLPEYIAEFNSVSLRLRLLLNVLNCEDWPAPLYGLIIV